MLRLIHVSLVAVLIGVSPRAEAEVVFETQKLTASERQDIDLFGWAVAISGETMVVGTPDDNVAIPHGGSASVFVRGAGSAWIEQAVLSHPDALDAGYSVAISGDTILIGDPKIVGGEFGSVYVFVRNGTTWSLQAEIENPDPTSGSLFGFGYSVALEGDTALIGVPDDDDGGSRSGSAYVFIRSGAAWIEQAKLTAQDAQEDDRFGWATALSGDTVLIGAFLADGGDTNLGAAYVFTRSGSTWSERRKLTANDGDGAREFGQALAIEGDTALVGAHRTDSDLFDNSGAVYVFTGSGSAWAQEDILHASDASEDTRFGVAVAIDGDTAIFGANQATAIVERSGAAYRFERSGGIWSEQSQLLASDAEFRDSFGASVAVLSGQVVVVGAPTDDDGGNNLGSAYVFDEASVLFSDGFESGDTTAWGSSSP